MLGKGGVSKKKGQESCVPKANLKKLFSEESKVLKCPVPLFVSFTTLKPRHSLRFSNCVNLKLFLDTFRILEFIFPLNGLKN